jgi:hypothetical protein
MSMTNDRVKMSQAHAFNLALSGLEGDLASFVSSLIKQNAELVEKLQNIDSLTELAEQKVIEAGKEAEAIKAAAEMEANARAAIIVAGVEVKTKAAAQEVMARARKKTEAEAKRIIAEASQRSEDSAAEVRKEVEEEALILTKETSELLVSRKQTAKSLTEVSQELCAILDRDETIKAACQEGHDRPPVDLEPDATGCAPVDGRAQEPIQDDPSSDKQEGDEKESPGSYADFVDMVLPPPISLSRMLKLRRQLNKNPGVRVIVVKGSLDKGLWIRFIVRAHTPLLNVFEALAEVDGLSYAVIEVGKIFSIQKMTRWGPAILERVGRKRASSRDTDICLNDGSPCTQ